YVFAIFHIDAGYVHKGERAGKKVALPLGKLVSRVEQQAASGDRWGPVVDRLLQAFFFGQVGDDGAAIINAVGNDWPPVILAFFDDVDLVASPRAVLGGVDDVVGLVVYHALHVSVAKRPDASLGSRGIDKGIVLGNASVIMQAVHLAHVVVEFLR